MRIGAVVTTYLLMGPSFGETGFDPVGPSEIDYRHVLRRRPRHHKRQHQPV